MIEKIERRASLELRVAGRKLEGYAAVFNQSTRILDFTETIAPGAFTDTLRENKDTLALVDHDASKLLGRTAAGTLKLSQDSKGLAFQIDTPDTTLAKDMLALAERGDIGGASFAFPGETKGFEHHKHSHARPWRLAQKKIYGEQRTFSLATRAP